MCQYTSHKQDIHHETVKYKGMIDKTGDKMPPQQRRKGTGSPTAGTKKAGDPVKQAGVQQL